MNTFAKYRHNLPQLSQQFFISDGGLETTLVFRDGLDLPGFAAFTLLRQARGQQILRQYFETYIDLAIENQVGMILESVTWRANPDWATQLGYSHKALEQGNHQAIAMLQELRQEYETDKSPMVISGCIGPRGDGYAPDQKMSIEQAQAYHQIQIHSLAEAGADCITAMTINYTEEAIGIVQAAQAEGIAIVISFTVETDGKLPTGQTLQDAIVQVDAKTQKGPIYYMLNCAHPTHFADVLIPGEAWIERIRGIRANASPKSHAELDESATLDDGNPEELGQEYRQLLTKLPHLNILGGCCGTDLRHVKAICQACLPVFWASVSGQWPKIATTTIDG